MRLTARPPARRDRDASDYPERFPRSNCRQNARWMVMLHPELSYIEGYLVLTDPEGTERRVEHAWNEAPGGQLVDSTGWEWEEIGLPYRYERDPQAWARLAARIDALRGAHR